MLHLFGELIAFWSFNLGLKSPLMTKDLSVCRREKECVFVVCVWVFFWRGGVLAGCNRQHFSVCVARRVNVQHCD